MFKQLLRMNAQVGADTVAVRDKHGTMVVGDSAAKPPMMVFCCGVELKTLVLVNKGTEFCASERRPS